MVERFSEDIDLILDWRKVISDGSNPWEERSKTKQDMFNKEINSAAALFYREQLVPALNLELECKLGAGEWVAIDDFDEMIINFKYPKDVEMEYIVPVVRLEIGPLAEWMPSHPRDITSFAAEIYPHIFEKTSTEILTIDAERTFWEKITILHKMANFPEGKTLPRRYARHLYDVYNMANSPIRESAFKRKELLEKDVLFKQKFYYARNAHYETATIAEIQLLPAEWIVDDLRADYAAMKGMIYGSYPTFEEILERLKVLQDEIHELI